MHRMETTLAEVSSCEHESLKVDAEPLSFEAVYETHFDFVWRSLRRRGLTEPRIDDAVQDVFLVIHRKLSDFQQRSSLKTWIFGIVVRVAHDHHRSKRRKD